MKRLFDKKIIFYILVFCFYIFIGVLLSFEKNYTDFFFGADNARVFGDITNALELHYRIKVHPLFVLFIEPIFYLLNIFLRNKMLSVIVIESLAGTSMVYFFDKILTNLKIKNNIKNVFVLIFVFSFSMMIFSIVPETFIFGGLGLISYYFFLSYINTKKGELSKKERYLLILFGIINFGITITNFGLYILGLIYILLSKYKINKAIKEFIKINIFNLIFIIILNIFQRIIWSTCPLFWSSIIEGLNGNGYEEVLYMDFNISISKVIELINQMFNYSIISPNIELGSEGVCFTSYNFVKYFIIITNISIMGLGIKHIYDLIKKKDKINNYILTIFFCLLYNIVLHFIYGYNEAFIYSPHYLFFMLILVSYLCNRISKNIVLNIYLIIYLIIEFIFNLLHYIDTLKITREFYGHRFLIKHSCIISGGLFVILLGISILYKKIFYKKIYNYKYKDYINLIVRLLSYIFMILIIISILIGIFVR